MIYLKAIEKSTDRTSAFPFEINAIRNLSYLEFTSEVTILVGANGSGKSTLIEAIAIASKRTAISGVPLDVDPSLAAIKALSNTLRLVWNKRTHKGFFLRAEDFFKLAVRNRELTAEMERFASQYDQERVKRMFLDQKKAVLKRYRGDLDEQSYGEGFLTVFGSRIVPGGLYFMDEPEAALSPQAQLSLLYLINEAVKKDHCQFVIATHSPMLAAYPGALLLSLDGGTLKELPYHELGFVDLYRRFLSDPQSYLRRLFTP